MREELTFWLAVGLVSVASVAIFRLAANSPTLGRFGSVRGLDRILSAPSAAPAA